MNNHRSKQTTIEEFNEKNYGKGTKGNIFVPSQQLIGVTPTKKTANHGFNLKQIEEREKDILKYNRNITTLDEDYTSPESFGFFIVRAFLIEPTYQIVGDTKIDITEWRERKVLVESGNGVKETVKSEWQFKTRAVVINIPKHLHIKPEDLKVGDIIQIDKEIILPKPQGLRESLDNVMVYSYTLPEWTSTIAPTDMSNKHFGYFKVPREALLTKLKSA